MNVAGDIFATSGGERVGNILTLIQSKCHVCNFLLRLQVLCIFLFMVAVSLFGTIIAEVNEIVRQITLKKKDLEKILETYQSVHPRLLIVQNLEILR